MFKNSKMLKGIVLALALVLVLGAGVALNLRAAAEANTVVLYVSENGNNTTGKDAATAFTDIAAATKAANDMKLAPGTPVKILIVDRVYSDTRYMDGSASAKDSAGGKLQFTIASADPSEKAEIIHHHYNSSGSSTYERINIANDITFENVSIVAEVQPYYEANAPFDPNAVDYGKLYRTRYFHVGNNKVVLDNCEFTSTVPDQSAAKSWTLLCDSYAKVTTEGASSLTLKNGDYSNCTVYVQDQITPLWDLSLYVENASAGTVYALADTDTATSVNAKSVTCTFKDATVSSYRPQGRGHIGVTEGVTATFEGDTVVKNWVGAMNSTSSTPHLNGDLRFIFRDNCSISVTSGDVYEGSKYMYLTPHGTMNGDLYVTVEGGTFNNRLVTGSDTNDKTKATAVLNGNIYNEFKGGTFKSGISCGHGNAGGTINGTITNNFYDGFHLASGTSYFSSRNGKCGTTTNNFYGGQIDKVEVYFGGGGNGAAVDKNVLDGDLINNIYGGTFGSTVWAGPHSQTITGTLYNNFMGGTFKGGVIAGGVGSVMDEMHNTFKNGPDGTHATFASYLALGVRGTVSATNPNVQGLKRLYNTFEGDAVFNGYIYGAGGTQSGGKVISELVQNTFKGGTFAKDIFCGARYAKDNIGDVVNYFYDGATFNANVYGGSYTDGAAPKSITNNIYGGTFNGLFLGGNANRQRCDITNNVYGGHFVGSSSGANDSSAGRMCFLGGSNKRDSGTTRPTLTNNVYGGIFEQRVYFGGTYGTYGEVHTMVAGGIFNGARLQPTMYDINTDSLGATEVTFDIKPDESDQLLLLGCYYQTGAGYTSYGLEKLVPKTGRSYTVTLHGAKKPVYITGRTLLNLDKVEGEVTLVQTENWVNGNVYVTVPDTEDLSNITVVNGMEGLSGSTTIGERNRKQHHYQSAIDCTALIGSSSAEAPATAPTLSAVKFVLDNNLQLQFFAKKADVEAYLDKVGKFDYKITCGEEVLASGTLTSMDQAEVVGTYVKVTANFAIPAFDYAKELTVDLAGNLENRDFTVYSLLQRCMLGAQDQPETLALLKAIFNYGVEAEKLHTGKAASVSDYYSDITYTGTYEGSAVSTSNDAGYKFYGSALSIGKDVALNFYLQAASADDLVITASSAKGALDPARVVVTPFEGNSNYNVVVSLKLDVGSMDQVFTVSVKNAAGTELATCSNCVAYCCEYYIANSEKYAPVSKAILAYVEKAHAMVEAQG